MNSNLGRCINSLRLKLPFNSLPSIISSFPVRGVKTTSTVHPKPTFDEDEKILSKVLKERELSDDLVIN